MSTDRLASLVVRCLEAIEVEGDAAIERFGREHPDLAAALRAQLESLRRFGMLPGERPIAPGAVPERLGEFRLLERLGRGGMGIVYRAEQTSLAREVALKLVRPEQLFFEGARARFLREVAIVAKLDHPGIVPVYAVGEEHGVPYYAMQRVVGCTLADAIDELGGRRVETLCASDLRAAVERRVARATTVTAAAADPSPSAAHSAARAGTPISGLDEPWIPVCLRLIAQVAQALAHAHGRGVIHRDLKPSNVMIDLELRPRLVDFGLASSGEASRLTRTGSQLGSLPYMAPEQVRGDHRAVDARTDVYQLGITLFELLTLRLPYSSESSEELRRQILEALPPPLRALNRRVEWDVETVCLTAMERDGARRYASVEAFERDLQNLLAHRTIEARRPGPLLRARRLAQRRPAATVGIALGALSIVGGLLGYAWFQDRARRDLVREQGLTSRQRDRADAESRRAKENFRRLLAAMNELLVPLLDERGDHLPEMEALRQRMLERALAIYDGIDPADAGEPELERDLRHARLQSAFIDRVKRDYARAVPRFERSIAELEAALAAAPDDASLALDLGQAFEGLGAIKIATTDVAAAELLLRRAVETLARVPESDPLAVAARRDEIRAHRQLAFAMGEQLRLADAEAAARAAIAIGERLVAAHPDDLHARGELAKAHLELAKLLATLVRGDRVAEGMRQFDLVIGQLRELQSLDGGERSTRWNLATTHLFRGRAHDVGGDLERAGADFAAALQIGDELRARFPEVTIYSSDTGFLASQLGAVRLKQGRFKEAREVLATGRPLLAAAARAGSADPTMPYLHGELLMRLAEAERRLGDPDAALAACDEAIAVGSRPIETAPAWVARRQREWPWTRIEIEIETGDLDGAAESIDALLPGDDAPPVDRAQGAALFARCAAKARALEDLDDEQRERIAAGFDEDALDQLEQALAEGFRPERAWLAEAWSAGLTRREDVQSLLARHGVELAAARSSGQ